MEEKKNNNDNLDQDDSVEIIERLDPITEYINEDATKQINDELMDSLFRDELKPIDKSLDGLFEEDRKIRKKNFNDEVQKALSQPTISKASLYRLKSKAATDKAFAEELANQKTVEETWDEPADEAFATANRKSVIFMWVLIAAIVIACVWAILQSVNDIRGNEKNLISEEIKSLEKEQKKSSLFQEIGEVSEVVDRYLSASTVDEKSKYIFQSGSLKAEIDSYYKQNRNILPMKDYTIQNVLPINFYGEEVWEVFIETKDRPNEGVRCYYVRKDTFEEYKVDWEADVVLQKNDIKKFKETRSREATKFKFEVEPIYQMSIYNWGFTDIEYQAYKLTLPDSDMVFWGYVKRDSPEEIKLNRYIERNLNNTLLNTNLRHEFILGVRFLPDSPKENDQYILIDDVVSRKWMSRKR